MESIGKYQIIRKLGAGGFGAVYLCKDPRLGVEVAIKVFQVRDDNLVGQITSASQDAGQVLRERFLAEAKTLHQLSHSPYIVNIKDYDELEDGTPYYVMPYLPQSLEGEIGKDAFSRGRLEEIPASQHPRKLPLHRALTILEQLLQAMAQVHDAGLIHRDLKPANILFDEQGNVQVCDFGIAKLPDAQYSQSGVGMGSRNYMSPEQRESAKYVTPASDVYSLGILAYRMLTGQLPLGKFDDVSHFVPEIGKPLNDLIDKAISQNDHQRPQDAGDFLTQFQQALAEVDDQGVIHDEATTTWVGGNASVKTELQPLEQKIIQLLKRQGEVRNNDFPVLQALAELGGLDNDALSALIKQVTDQQASQHPKQKAFQQWVAHLNSLQVKGESLSAQQKAVLIEAGEASTGMQASTLEYFINEKLPSELTNKEIATTPDASKQTAQVNIEASGKEKPKRKKRWMVRSFMICVCIGAVLYGYTLYATSLERDKAIKSILNAMVEIPSGNFQMGCSLQDDQCFPWERPVHNVAVPGFKLMSHEVTFAMWDACLSSGGCWYNPDDEGWGRGDQPLINVTHKFFTKQFIPWLNNVTGQTFRLPSEAEWEYAARAGSQTKYSWGNAAGSNNANCEDCGSRWDNKRPAPVKSFSPNALGLFDMEGNVFEWTADHYSPNYSDATNTAAPWLLGNTNTRVLRGGSWNVPASYLRVSSRTSADVTRFGNNIGFRLAQD